MRGASDRQSASRFQGHDDLGGGKKTGNLGDVQSDCAV